MSWMKSTHQTMISVDYQAEFEMFAQNENLDAWDHAANLHFRQQIAFRWSLDAADAFLSTDDPTRQFNNSLLLLPRGRYHELALYARLAYRLDQRTVLSFRFDNAVTTIRGESGDPAKRERDPRPGGARNPPRAPPRSFALADALCRIAGRIAGDRSTREEPTAGAIRVDIPDVGLRTKDRLRARA